MSDNYPSDVKLDEHLKAARAFASISQANLSPFR